KTAFIRTLKLDEEHTIVPENSHLFAAIGSALNSKPDALGVPILSMRDRLQANIHMDFEVDRMEPLFSTKEDYLAFHNRQSKYNVKTAKLSTYKGNCYLGIDAGSTTTKAALVGEDGSLLYSFYSNNNGNPLATSIKAIQEIYAKMPAGVKIAYSCSTGYGEALIKAALMLDE
ncbi:CoA-substrate-specific enzyme activase, partial [gut metagenome]